METPFGDARVLEDLWQPHDAICIPAVWLRLYLQYTNAAPGSVNDIRLATETQASVLITSQSPGERQTCARLIHTLSAARASGPFVAFLARSAGAAAALESSGCGRADPSDSEAVLQELFDQARGGTFFIDEIANLTVGQQTRLMSLLERPVSASVTPGGLYRCDVRVIAGSSRRLDTECAKGTFLEPLFYRLNVVHVDLTSATASNGSLSAAASVSVGGV